MTQQEYNFYKDNELEEKGYDACSLRYYDDRIQIYTLTEDDHAVVDVKTGKVEFRELTAEENEILYEVEEGELEAVVDYTIEKGYAEADEGFCHLLDLEGGKMIWYVAKINKETGKAEEEEFVVTYHTLPIKKVRIATEEELEEYDEYVAYCDDVAHECAEEDERIDHIEFASTFRMKYKLYPDIVETMNNGEESKICYMFLNDNDIYTAGGLEVVDMEDDLKDPMSLACRDAVLKRLEAYRAKQDK